jgi:hypothetical protein
VGAVLELVTATRVCAKCGACLPVASFKPRAGQQSLRKTCRDCDNAAARERYAARISHYRQYHRDKKRGLYSRAREFDPIRWMLAQCKNRARATGLDFDLTRDDLFLPEFCPVLGLRLTQPGEGQQEASPSIDRLDPRKGYVRGNVAVISMRANRLKNDATANELARITAWMRAQGAV